MMHNDRLIRGVRFMVLLGIASMFMVPLFWMILTSIHPADQVMNPEGIPWPRPAADAGRYAVDNYSTVLNDEVVRFPVYLRNSLYVALLGVLGTVVSSTIVAYGFSRVRWRGRQAMFIIVLMTMMIPFPVVMVPLFVIFRELGWIGTFMPLWVPAWFGNAFSIFLLRQFFLGIPRELDDAARIDGCGHAGILRHVVLPLSTPAIAVVALLQFMFLWNDFLGPLIFLVDWDQYTLALGLHLYQSRQGETPWHLLMAASTLFVAPVVVLFLFTQRSFVEGIATGAVKGA